MSKRTLASLKAPSLKFRGTIARGLAAGEKQPRIDPTGGLYDAGIIRGCAVITRGEALGHGMWCDRVFLTQVATAIELSGEGLKARFTHPGLSGDGLGKFIGRFFNASVDGDIVRADLHLAQSATDTPDGDLAGYVLQLAAEDPAAFGTSIVFQHDPETEEQFVEANGGYEKWLSPDPDNVQNYYHCRLGELLACDAVDEPAANPGGLFHRAQEIPQGAEALLNFALGLSAEKPAGTCFDVDPDRAAAFVTRYLARHNLAITKKEAIVPKKTAAAAKETQLVDQSALDEAVDTATDATDEAKTDESTSVPAPAAQTEEEKPADEAGKSEETQAAAKTGQDFLEAFGDRGGVLFAQGKSFEEAQQIVLQETREENDRLKADNAKLKKSLGDLRGDEPVSSGAEPTAAEAAALRYSQNLGPNLGRLAAHNANRLANNN